MRHYFFPDLPKTEHRKSPEPMFDQTGIRPSCETNETSVVLEQFPELDEPVYPECISSDLGEQPALQVRADDLRSSAFHSP
jgi:hypothetical protein